MSAKLVYDLLGHPSKIVEEYCQQEENPPYYLSSKTNHRWEFVNGRLTGTIITQYVSPDHPQLDYFANIEIDINFKITKGFRVASIVVRGMYFGAIGWDGSLLAYTWLYEMQDEYPTRLKTTAFAPVKNFVGFELLDGYSATGGALAIASSLNEAKRNIHVQGIDAKKIPDRINSIGLTTLWCLNNRYNGRIEASLALLDDGSFITWGNKDYGGFPIPEDFKLDMPNPKEDKHYKVTIQSNGFTIWTSNLGEYNHLGSNVSFPFE